MNSKKIVGLVGCFCLLSSLTQSALAQGISFDGNPASSIETTSILALGDMQRRVHEDAVDRRQREKGEREQWKRYEEWRKERDEKQKRDEKRRQDDENEVRRRQREQEERQRQHEEWLYSQPSDDDDKGYACFVAGTLVSTPKGQVRIEDIRAGDAVLSYDETTGRIVTARVLDLLVHPGEAYGRLTVSDGTRIGVTPAHRFYSGGRWEPIGKLEAGSSLLRMDGSVSGYSLAQVLSFDRPKPGETADVFNLSIGGTHNYFANGILVHNIKVIE